MEMQKREQIFLALHGLKLKTVTMSGIGIYQPAPRVSSRFIALLRIPCSYYYYFYNIFTTSNLYWAYSIWDNCNKQCDQQYTVVL